jgi:hypothetical protein
MATFCDGRQQFLRQDIDYITYEHLMTPNSETAGKLLWGSRRPPPDGWVNHDRKDQFGYGLPPRYDPDVSQPPNLASTVLDTSKIQ